MHGWVGHLFNTVDFRDADIIGHLDAPTGTVTVKCHHARYNISDLTELPV